MELGVIVFWQSRGAFIQLSLIYLVLCTVPLGLGALLLVAPRRGGNFLNEAFAIFPAVEQGDRMRKLCYRGLGAGFMMVSIFYIHQIYLNIGLPVAHFFRNSK
jgi:hypothetical protein